MKNLWIGIHVESFITSTLTEPSKRRNQISFFFFFLQSFLCVLLGVSGNVSVFSLASRDSLERVQHTGFGLSLLALLPTGMGRNPDFEEVGNKTRFSHLQHSSTSQHCCSAWTEVISSGPLIINLSGMMISLGITGLWEFMYDEKWGVQDYAK